MTSTALGLPYAQARSTEPKRPPLSTANFVFTVEDDDIMENIRYRIYDFCFDIEYDKILKPTIMQYIRVLDLPPHPHFNREQWEKTMVYGHWSHKPRGLAILGVSMMTYREAFFRFYWFHFPNWVLPKSNLWDLQRRLRKIPERHRCNVNASIKIHRKSAIQEGTKNSDALIVGYLTLAETTKRLGLYQINAPVVLHTNVDGRKERIILGKGFHIIEQLEEIRQLIPFCCRGTHRVVSLCLAGKLGNMILHRAQFGGVGSINFEASGCTLRDRDVNHLSSVPRGIHSNLSRQSADDAAAKQPTSERSPRRIPTMPYENTLHGPEPIIHHAPTQIPEQGQSSTAQLRGDDATLEMCDSEQNDEPLLRKEAGYPMHELKSSTSEEVSQPLQAEFELNESNDNGSNVENHKTEGSESSATHVTSREGDNADENNRQASNDPAETHILSPDQISSPLQPETGSLPTSESTRSRSTFEPMTARRSRESSVGNRVAQWIERENDPMSSRKSSNSWSDGKEAGELSSRKRVSSSAFHACLPRRSSSNKQSSSSSSAVHSTAATPCHTTSAEYPALTAPETLIQPPSTKTADDASVELTTALPSSSPQQQIESCEPLITTSPASVVNKTTTSPQPRALPLSENTDAPTTHAAQGHVAIATITTAGSTPQSRRASASSNNANLCIGNDGNVDEPIIVPGARQFLTPKRDVKPWWESAAGDRGSQSTGGKKRRNGAGGKGKVRERETRGSTSSWISLE